MGSKIGGFQLLFVIILGIVSICFESFLAIFHIPTFHGSTCMLSMTAKRSIHVNSFVLTMFACVYQLSRLFFQSIIMCVCISTCLEFYKTVHQNTLFIEEQILSEHELIVLGEIKSCFRIVFGREFRA